MTETDPQAIYNDPDRRPDADETATLPEGGTVTPDPTAGPGAPTLADAEAAADAEQQRQADKPAIDPEKSDGA